MSLVDQQASFLLDVGKLVIFATAQGFRVTGGELFRTPEQQKLHVEAGRSQTMDSQHLRRLAVDLNFIDSSGKLCYDKNALEPIGDFWESLNVYNRWGGHFRSFVDVPHFERRQV